MSEVQLAVPGFPELNQEITPRPSDTVWGILRADAVKVSAEEEILRGFIHSSVLFHDDYACALAALLAHKLGDRTRPAERLEGLAHEALSYDPNILEARASDLIAI